MAAAWWLPWRPYSKHILFLSFFTCFAYLSISHFFPAHTTSFTSMKYQLRQPVDFEGFDNETGLPFPIVPNIVHFIRFDEPLIAFDDAVCILAALKNQNPDQIYFHTNVRTFRGKYWNYLLKIPKFVKIFKIIDTPLPNTIFGQKFNNSNFHKFHASDVTRIRILIQYGGIFLDNDSYLVKSLDRYRHFEMTIGWDDDQCIGSQVIVAHPDARFLNLWLESYRENYHSDLWYYNTGEFPTKVVLLRQPELVHRVRLLFGVDMLTTELYTEYWSEWRDNYAIHLLLNHRYYLVEENYEHFPRFNERNVKYKECNFTYCHMAKDVFFYFRTKL